MPFSCLDPCKMVENLEPVRKDAGPKENVGAEAALDALEDAEQPKSTTDALNTQTPVEKEREMARKREQERRRREAVSICIRVEVRDLSKEHLNICCFSLTDIWY